jgi:uncharacterized protein YndB with AHSA1/START domain
LIEQMEDYEIVTTRTVHAAREAVWEAWTNPILLAQWWGPKGFRNTFYEFDLQPGGAWRFIMHSPDEVHFPNESVFQEIAQPERIVFKHLAPVHEFLLPLSLLSTATARRSVSRCASLRPLSPRDRGAMWRREMKRIWTGLRRFWLRRSETTIRSRTKEE